MLRRRGRWSLTTATVLLLLSVLSPVVAFAEHERAANGEGDWTPLVERKPVKIRHHNPWVCTNPPTTNLGPPHFATGEGPCEWPGAYPYVYQGVTLGTSARRDGLVVTSCTLDAGEPVDCGHDPNNNGQWEFAGSGHAIHKANVTLIFGHLCPTSAGGQGFTGGKYTTDGHKVSGPGPETCGTWVPGTPTVSISGVTVTEGGRAVLSITSSGGSAGSVEYRTVNGTAQAGEDFSDPGSASVPIPASGTASVSVDTTNDTEVEGTETFTVVLSNPSGVDIGTGTATVTITDNDNLGTVNITGATVTEGGNAVVEVKLSGGNVTGTVNYGTTNGSARAPSDYTTTTGTLTFTPTALSPQVIVPTNDDDDDEGTETFTVRLFNASNVSIGTAEATVHILDDDDPDPPQRCQAGQHAHNPVFSSGYHPVGLKNTDPHRIAHGGGSATGCFGDHPATAIQQVQPVLPVQTGCNAPSTRLRALSATAGTYSLSGFSPTTYSYSLAVIGVRYVQVSATAADSGASVSIYGGNAYPGSASRRILSYNSFSVKVTNSGQSCTYRVEMSYEAAPLTECPSMSGQELVNGVCVPACSADFIPQFDNDGQVTGCIPLGDCPFEMYGTTAADVASRGRFWFWPRWLDGPQDFSPVAVGESGTLTRRVAKCANIWNFDPFGASPGGVPDSCIWRETNIGLSDGDCLRFSISVEAVVPEVEDTNNRWSYTVSGCGYNASADRVASTSNPWMPDDRNCYSADGQWGTGFCWMLCGGTQPTGIDTGDWTVTLGNLTEPRGGIFGDPYVDVPLEVEVTDWGDVSHLQIRVEVGAHQLVTSYDDRLVASFARARNCGSRCNYTSRTVTVPRMSGPIPADDVIEVNISEVDDLPIIRTYWRGAYRRDNQQRVQILRSQLLANDACPVGTDCTDPYQWPIQIVDDDARRCSLDGPGSSSMVETEQGVVGCDELNEVLDPPDADDPPAALYWPQLWAVGEDRFSYRTYGGDATVTVRFTDTVPVVPAVVAATDTGERLQEAIFRRTASNYVCIRYRAGWMGYPTCAESAWRYTFARDDSTITDQHYHSGVVAPPTPEDADGDYAGRLFLDGGITSNDVDGRAAMSAEWLPGGVERYVVKLLGIDIAPGSDSGMHSRAPACTSYREEWVQTGSYVNHGYYRRICTGYEATDGVVQAAWRSSAGGHSGFSTSCISSTSVVSAAYGSPITRYIPVEGRSECTTPRDTFACTFTLMDGEICYSAMRRIAEPVEARLPYLDCDQRYLYYLDDTRKAEAAGRSVDDYCTTGTVILYLGSAPSEVNLTSSHYSTNEGTPLRFDIQLSEAALTDAVVDYTVTDITAVSGQDYSTPSGRVTVHAGDTTASIYVVTTQDSVYEADETLQVVLTAATGAQLGPVAIAVGTIINDDSLPVVGFVRDVSASEDNSVAISPPRDVTGDGIPDTAYVYGESARFIVRLAGNSAQPVSVTYTIADGTATGVASCPSYPGNTAEDYRQTSNTLTFAPGETSKTVTIRFCPDDQTEPDETFTVTLSNPVGATLGTDTATGTITDDDSPTQPVCHPWQDLEIDDDTGIGSCVNRPFLS